MQLALLGVDADMLAAASAAVEYGHDLAVIWLHGDAPPALYEIAPQARIVVEWEGLLDRSAVDAVLVASGDDDLRAEQLRKLVQQGMPLLVSHPVCPSMLVYYELDMIRAETACVMVPYLPDVAHPAVSRMTELIQGEGGACGPIEQIVFDRGMRDRSRSAVLAQFARDVALVRILCGDVTRLGAMGPVAGAATYAGLGVQMTGPSSALARWSAGPQENEPCGRITAIGRQGKAVLSMPDDRDAPWRFELQSGDAATVESYPNWDRARTAIDQLTAAIEGRTSAAPPWSAAARSVELAETIDRSLAKGRTVELHHEEFSDVGTFKGTMTSLGCGLLIAAIVAAVAAAVANTMAKKAGWPGVADLLKFWPHALLGLLGLFLIAQFVLKLAAPETKSSPLGTDAETRRRFP